uniref:uncharacterized protein LOC122594883 isoform X2 n=1 Tax=Erigeron canadensis TaxID=72917 RepID=UPI001CB98F89|nr:uncharacterized protein LOC122594883 isoform X2 [Erigeron canadensis]
MPPFPNSRMAFHPPPSFFSLMLNPSATTLKISDEFVTKHLKNKIPKGPIVICSNEGHSWRTKIKKVGENYYFDSGWTNVVKDANFMFGDFVLFTLVEKYKFEMVVYDKNSCERSLPKKVKVVEDDGSSSVDNVAANVHVVNDDDDDDDDDDADDGKQEEDDDAVDIDGDDGDPFFMSTISKAHRTNLRLPDEFVKLAGIEDVRSIMLKNLDGEEWRTDLWPDKVNQSENLYISSGWAKFQQSNDLWEGDECVFKFITSENKILIAKVTKKKRPARQSQPPGECSKTDSVKRKRGRELHAHGRDVDVESEDEYMQMVKRLCGNDEDEEHEDSDEIEEGEGDNDDVDGDEGEEDYEEKDGVDIDGNPYFKITIRNGYKSHLVFPSNFVRLARIEAAGTITLKNLDGEESSMSLRLGKNIQKTYYISLGWAGFRRSNKVAIGDECVFKYIISESKFCLAKVTKKQKSARQPQPSAKLMRTDYVKRKRGRSLHEHGRDINVESEDECMEVMKRLRGNDEDDEHEDSDEDEDEDGKGDNDDVDGDEGEEDYEEKDGVDIDGNPYFKLTIRNGYKSQLRFSTNFVRLARIKAAGTITLKNLDGEESSMSLRLQKSSHPTYYISLGWPAFRRSNKIALGDECVFKYITSESKFCLAKVTKKKKSARQPQPSAELMRTDYVKRKWGRSLHEHGGDMIVESEDECVEVIKRTCGEDNDKDNDEDNYKNICNDINDDDENNDNDGEDEDDRNGDIAGDPFFTPIISRHRTLLLPKEFVGLPGIHAGGTILLKNLKGEEWQIGVLLNKSYKSERYLLSAGWVGFLRSNDISAGEECLLKYIRKENKFCLAKVTKKQRPAWQPQPPVEDIDGNPLFMLIISGESTLRLPEKFVELSGIHADETIKLKNNKGEEWQIGVLLDTLYHKSERYIFSAGWLGFQQSNDLSIGDECIIKFIRKEGKFCLAKVTKKQKQAWSPQLSGQILATKDVKRKRGLPPHEQGGDVDVESEDDCVELVKRPCGEDDNDNDDDNYEDKDNNINDDDNHNHNDDEDEADGGSGGDIDGDPFFASIISRLHTLRLPGEFVGYPGINADGTIMLKNLKGEEWRIGVLLDKTYLKSERYILSAGMLDFMQNNDILVGDECIIKLIKNEGKLCLAKVRKKYSPARQPLPSGEILATTGVVKRNRGQPVEVVTRLCGEDHDEENDCKNDGLDNGINNGKDNDNDGDDNKHGDVGDPSFSMNVSKRPFLVKIE